MSADDARATVRSDRELLALARGVLEEEQYAVEDLSNGLPLLLAENRYFVVGVVATPTLRELILAESMGEAALTDRMRATDPGPKRWDAYLVLMTQERSPDDSATARQLFSINYDTSSVRRIAHSGVSPTVTSVREALTPFVAPIELEDQGIASDPFAAMVEALAARGIERGFADRAVDAFRQGADLDDIL